MSAPFRVLIVEDVEDDYLLLLRQLTRGGFPAASIRVETETEMRAALERESWDVVIADFQLPAFSGPAALRVLKSMGRDLPLIIVSGMVGETSAVAVMKDGAHDFILKNNLSRLVPAVEREIREARLRRDHRASLDALRESEQRLRAILETVTDALVIVGRDGQMEYANPAAETILGLERSAIAGRVYDDPAWSITAPDGSPFPEEELPFVRVMRTGEPVSGVEHAIIHPNGSRVVLSINSAPLRGGSGETVGMVAAIRDVTVKNREEELVRQSQRLLQGTLDSISAHLAILDADARILAVNEAWRRFGRERGVLDECTIIGADYLRIAPLASDGSAVGTGLGKGIRAVLDGSRSSFILEHSAPSSAGDRWFVTRVDRFEGSAAPRAVVSHVEITDRKNAEREILRREAEFRALAENSPDLVVRFGRDLRLRYINPAIERITGVPPERYVGAALSELEMPASRVEQIESAVQRVLRGETSEEIIEFPVRSRAGERWFQSRIVPERQDDEGLATVLSLSRDVTTRRVMEEALRQSEERFRQVFDSAEAMIALIDADGVVQQINRAGLRIVGYPAEEVHGQHLADFAHVDDRVRIADFAAKLASGDEEKMTLEARFVRANGMVRWGRLSGSVVRHGPGEPDFIIAILHDITERRAAAAAIHRRERYFRSLIEHASDVITILDGEGTIIYESPAVTRLTGFREEQLVGKDIFDFIHPADVERVRAEFARTMTEPESTARMDLRFLHTDGSWRIFETVATNLLEDPAVGGIVANSRDVTAIRLAAEKIRFQAELLDTVGEAVIATDADGRIVYWNRYAEGLYGWDRQEVLGRSIHDVVVSEETAEQAATIMDAVKAGRSWSGEFKVRRRDGTSFPAHVTDSPIFDDEGHLIGVLGISRDLTARKQLEAQLAHAQKMEAIGRLAGGIAHDFNNLMMTVGGYAEMILKGLPPGDPLRPDLEQIERAADRATELTRKLLAFSRRQVLELEPVDVNRVVEDLRRLLVRIIGEDVVLVTDFEPDLVEIPADAGQLEQVIMNLALNARDAMPDGGTLSIRTRSELRSAVGASGMAVPVVVLEVADSGTGITQEVKDTMFEPFFTTKEEGKGTGLGLPTVSGIVQQFGGWIEVDSVLGVGSTFRISLPQGTATKRVVAAIAPTVGSATYGAATILLVEDEESVRGLLERMLNARGFDVLLASDGLSALQIAREHPGTIDILLTDVVMPQMGGKELAERLLAERPLLRTIFMSGYSEEAVKSRGALLDDALFLPKPIRPDELMRALGVLTDAL